MSKKSESGTFRPKYEVTLEYYVEDMHNGEMTNEIFGNVYSDAVSVYTDEEEIKHKEKENRQARRLGLY
jgi:hypothetical protein